MGVSDPGFTLKYTGEVLPDEAALLRGMRPYFPEPGLVEAVGLAMTLERPLLLKGAPGLGKSSLAKAVAYELGHWNQAHRPWPYEEWPVKSTSRARDGLYTFDAVGRLRDAQRAALAPERPFDINDYIHLGPLGRAFKSDVPAVVLIDGVDRADIDFPNDLLVELDEQRFQIEELRGQVEADQEWVTARYAPIVIITSDEEKVLPDAFLRRCIFYYIEFPSPERMLAILGKRFPDLPIQEMEALIR